MRLERVVNLDFGHVAIAPEGAQRVFGIGEDDDEIVYLHQPPVHLLTGSQGNRYRSWGNVEKGPSAPAAAASSSAGHQEAVLHLLGIGDPGSDTFQVAGGRMARGALDRK